MAVAADLRQKSDDELKDELQKLKREQLNLRFQRFAAISREYRR
mgnify:CR=1 FL=1